MKYCALVLLSLFIPLKSSAQGHVFAGVANIGKSESNYVARENNFRKHCIATKTGKIMLVAGGVGVIGGVAGIVTPIANKYDDLYGDSYKVFTNVIFGGVSFGLIGGIIYLMGRDIDANHKLKKISVITGNNQTGIAYNF